MKNTIVVILVLCSLNSYSQITNGKIEYTIKFEENEYPGLDFYQEAIKGSGRVSYSLEFSNGEALFFVNSYLSTDDNSTSLAISFGGVYSPIYCNLETNEVLYNNNENSLLSIKEEFIIKKTINKDWNIQNESKIIDGYTCYKAVSSFVSTSPNGKAKYPVIAWFCPKIPVPLGPKGYGGLPGLILELQERHVVFGAKSIALNIQDPPKVQRPSKGEIISLEAFETIQNERRKILKEMQK